MSGCQRSTKWAGCYPCRRSHTSGGLGGAGEAPLRLGEGPTAWSGARRRQVAPQTCAQAGGRRAAGGGDGEHGEGDSRAGLSASTAAARGQLERHGRETVLKPRASS
eukprot:scaffold58765_cov60-Phaeocystis_antarctica.AAC.2